MLLQYHANPHRAYELPFPGMDSKDLVLINEEVVNGIKEILVKRKETIAVAESVTAGIFQTALASATDASLYFQGGITTYNIGQKARHLNINSIHAEACNCVSAQVAEEMAKHVCGLFSSDWGIGITGYATVDPAIKMKEPFAYYAICNNQQVKAAGLLRHEETEPALIQYYYVDKILRELYSVLKKVKS